ncbi:MAG: DUF4445 domain-containing protein, partial [Deltaproteobacteria bacterium]|nr:DUF4445 domain-containing protein [Deltaproteobacteria bacterium]
RLLGLERGDATGRQLGLALDLGTTTLVAELIDLTRGQSLSQVSLTNPQTELGPDVLTRIQQAAGPGLARLQALAVEGVNALAQMAAQDQGFAPEEIICLSVAGNTTMSHLFLGLDPSNICRQPYIPVVNQPDLVSAGQLGLNLHPRAPVFVLPNTGSYFGGDLIAGLLSSSLAQGRETCLLVDVGTNAEVVVGNKDWLMGCAGAAGPALEGGVAKMGLPAGPGAIERVRIDARSLEPELRIIGPGPGPARGLCGSGLIDLVAELFLAGVIDLQGKMAPLDHPRIVKTEDGLAFEVVSRQAGQEPVYFSQLDLDVLLRSKAAMYTILTTLLGQVGLTPEDIATFYVAGTFGQHIDPRQAIVIGMLPDLPLDRYRSLGNSSLAGAVQTLVSAQARRLSSQIRDRITYLELNVNQEFMNRFSAAKFLPHTDLSLFPSVPRPAARPEARIKT